MLELIYFKCVGSTHEYYDIHGKHVNKQLHSIRINDIGDGGCKEDKFERDIRLLEDDLKNDPNNTRTHFYLASSYKNSGNINKGSVGKISKIGNIKIEYFKNYSSNSASGIVGKFKSITGADKRVIIY